MINPFLRGEFYTLSKPKYIVHPHNFKIMYVCLSGGKDCSDKGAQTKLISSLDLFLLCSTVSLYSSPILVPFGSF